MNIKTSFTFDKVDFSKESEIHAVVTLKAPKIDWEAKRQPICIIPVIDVSTSMAGDKLEYAKQSVLKLIEHLAPGDYCGLVAFGSQIFPLAEPREMSQANRDSLKTKVGALASSGCTNFAGGMRQALEWINNADIPDNVALRAIMFTDGAANEGEAKGAALVPLCKKLLGKATMSAFGYGSDCDQELLASLATEGKGNYAFIRNPDDALTAFAKELGGLLSRFAQDIVIDASSFGGHKIEEVISDVEVIEDGGKIKIKLPEILSEEERHIVFKFKTAVQSKAFPRLTNVLDIKVSFDQVSNGDVEHKSEYIKGKLSFVKAEDAQSQPTKAVMAIVAIAQAVQTQIKAEEMAKAGNYAGARGLFMHDAAKMDSMELDSHGDMLRGLAANYAGDQVYKSSSGLRSSMQAGLTRSAVSSDKGVQVALCSVGMSSSNSAMDHAVKSFTSNQAVAPVDPPVPVVNSSINDLAKANQSISSNGVSKCKSNSW